MAIVLAIYLIFSTTLSLAESEETITITVTSFRRDAGEQAVLLKRLYDRGVNLQGLYVNQDIIKEVIIVLDERGDVEEIRNILLFYTIQGRYLSKHMCGKALDISKKGKNIKDFISFMKLLDGVKILDEGDHYHIQTKESCNE